MGNWIKCSERLPSKNLYSQIVERANIDKITLPPFMTKLEDMMCGGIPLKSIVFLTAASGQGKTSFVNELVLHWMSLPDAPEEE